MNNHKRDEGSYFFILFIVENDGGAVGIVFLIVQDLVCKLSHRGAIICISAGSIQASPSVRMKREISTIKMIKRQKKKKNKSSYVIY